MILSGLIMHNTKASGWHGEFWHSQLGERWHDVQLEKRGEAERKW